MANASSPDSFNQRAEAYLEGDVFRRGPDLQLIVRWMQGRDRVCDVASGAGHVAAALRRSGCGTVVALDPAPNMVKTALRAHEGLIGAVAPAEALPFSSGSLDGLTCRIAAHHFRDLDAFLKETHRVLPPGGVAVVEDSVAPEDDVLDQFINRIERWRDPTHVRSYRASEWQDHLRERSFHIRESRLLHRRLEYGDWIERQDPPSDTRDRVRDAFLEAPPRVKRYFNVETDNGSVRSFTLPKLLVRAVVAGSGDG